MVDPIRRLSTDVRNAVSAGLRAGESLDIILIRVRELLAATPLGQVLQDALLVSAIEQFTWINQRTMTLAEQQDVLTILQVSAPQFALVGGNIETAVVEEVVRSIREGLPSDEIESILARQFSKGRARAQTVTVTAMQAFGRSARFRDAEAGGVLRMKYVGPPPERDVCRRWYHRSYTIAEIRRLDNGQGLPVDKYGGGFRCRHQWVIDD